MTDLSNTEQTSDICLLLRAHGEQRWLIYEVVPVVRQLEQGDSVPEDQLGAAFAYLEALWIEAHHRANETEAAFAELEPPGGGDDIAMHEKARRYYAAVHRLRDALGQRVLALLISTGETSADGNAAANGDTPLRRPIADRYASS